MIAKRDSLIRVIGGGVEIQVRSVGLREVCGDWEITPPAWELSGGYLHRGLPCTAANV